MCGLQPTRHPLQMEASPKPNMGALIITYTILGFLIKSIVYWAPKPSSYFDY